MHGEAKCLWSLGLILKWYPMASSGDGGLRELFGCYAQVGVVIKHYGWAKALHMASACQPGRDVMAYARYCMFNLHVRANASATYLARTKGAHAVP